MDAINHNYSNYTVVYGLFENYNGKYITYYVEHHISSDKTIELHRVENYTTR